MSKYGMNVKFTAKAGERDALAQILLGAAAAAEGFEGCEKYIISLSETEPDAVWVTEIWSGEEAHQASLNNEAGKALIQQARPLIAGVESYPVRPIGGKGL
ncbi:antibiotic biosynthesis monooxygenase [Paenibacillus sp. M1]|uniref:Antibiotic biosynthesis monooxygenase n=1 Tax=Paenibacillus haidiansis TaxID=1574488 RepID=A0ABU7VP85_9BACL